MSQHFLLSRLLPLYVAVIATYVYSRSLRNEENYAPLRPCSGADKNCDLSELYHRAKPESTLRANRSNISNSQAWSERKKRANRVRAFLSTEGCSSSQDLMSAGVKPSDDELDNYCDEHCDGVYSLGCIADYVTCSAGLSYTMSCPESLVLDVASEECVERSQAEACGNESAENAVAFGSGIESRATDFLSQNFSCLGLGNSFQSAGCSAICIACIFDEAILYAKCPGSLKFDVTSANCLPASSVNECTAEQEATTAEAELASKFTTSEFATSEFATSEFATSEFATSEFTTSEFATEAGLTEGSTEPTGELSELTTETTIIPGEESTEAVAFGASQQSQSVAFGASQSKPVASSGSGLSQSGTPTTVEQGSDHKMIAFSCSGKKDGLYGEQCAVEIVACFSERTVLMRCPEGFLFDVPSRICMEKDALPACGGEYVVAPQVSGNGTGEPVAVSSSQSQSLPEGTVAFGSAINETSPTPGYQISDYSCEGLQDGVYGAGCSNQSFVCVVGTPILLLVCPASKFDLSTASCMPEPEVSSCSAENAANGEAPILMQAASAFMQPQLPEAAVGASGGDIPISELNATSMQSSAQKLMIFSCAGFPDGIYGDMCATEFYVCIKGNAALLQCPDGFVYDAEAKYCSSRETMLQCPESQQAVGAGTGEETTEQPVTELVTEEAITEEVPEELITEEITEEPVIEEVSEVPVTEIVSEEPVTEEVPEVPVTEIVSEEPVTEEVPEVPVTEVVPEQPVPEAPAEFSCEFLPDGMYGQGCSTEFTACVGGSPIPMVCPANLKYDEESVKCLAAADVSACGGQELEPLAPEDESVAPVESRPPVVQSSFAAEAPSCEGKSDGLYGNGCSGEFYACVAGIPVPMRCPGLEKFDESTKKCLGGNYVPACGGESPADNSTTVAFGSGSPPATPPSPSSSEFSCTGLPDGVYVEGCSAEVNLCLSGKAIRYQCPEPLKYDTVNMMCSPQAEIAACQSESPTGESQVVSSSSGSQLPVPTETSQFTCTGKPDGAYARGCTANFVMCTSGLATYYQCPSPLKYDVEAEICREEELVSACVQPTTGSVSAGAPPTIDCSQQPDGPVSSGCSSEFQYCIGGELKQYTCPNGLKFDNVTRKCLAEELVPACSGREQTVAFGSSAGTELLSTNDTQVGGAVTIVVPIVYLIMKVGQPTPLPETTVAEEVITNFETISPIPEETTLAAEMESASPVAAGAAGNNIAGNDTTISCEGKENGAYSDGCASEFYVCIGGNILYLYCRTPLKFDHQSNQCVEAANIPACEESTDVVGFGSPSAANVSPCEGRSDGIYEKDPCSSDFFVCIGNEDTTVHCPDEYAYQQESHSCTAKAEVPECEPLLSSTTGEIAFGSEQGQSAASCEGKTDGLYSEDCSSEFFACLGGEAILMRCPGLQKFDNSTKQCLPQKYVEACGATAEAMQSVSQGISSFGVTAIEEGSHRLNPAGSVQSEGQPVVPKQIQDLFPVAPFVTTCIGLPDGKYSRGCSSEYVVCIAGQTKLNKCPSTLLKFDSISQQCLPAGFVKECGGEQAESSKIEPPVLLPNQTVAFGASTENEAPGFSCDDQPDGRYAQGCSPEFIECEDNEQKLLRCPGSLIFDGESQQCRPASYVNACADEGSVEPSTTITTTSNAEPVGAAGGTSTVSEPHRIDKPLLTSCVKLPDGIYARGCSAGFTLCVSGMPLLYHCPGQLMFDAQSEKCLQQSLVDSCTETGDVTTVEAITEVPVENTESFTEITEEPSVEPIAFGASSGVSESSIPVAYSITNISNLDSTLYFCLGRADGVYVDGCTSDFTVCVTHTTLALHCTNSLKYDEISGMCLDESEVAVCTAGTDSQSAAPGVTLSEGIQQAGATDSLQGFGSGVANTDLSAYCADRLDGLYTEGCSSEFVSCLHGHGTSYDCPDNLKFDVVSSICASESEVAACQNPAPLSASNILQPVGNAFSIHF